MKGFLLISVISTLLLSSIVLSNTLVGISYASRVQTQTQGPPLPNHTQRPSSQVQPAPAPICNPNSPTLQPGSTGAKVTELQRALTQVGYGSLLGKSGVDGKFGPSTQNAVKKFQQDNRLPVDGKVGPITWGTLCNIIPNSFIVQLKSASPGSFREIVGTLTRQLAEMGGRVAVYVPFGMFNVIFEGPLAKQEQFIKSLRTHPAVQGVFNDKIATAAQLPQKQVLPKGIDRVDAEKNKIGDGKGLPVNADIAILDTGVSSHPDLNVIRCLDYSSWLSPFETPRDKPCPDDNGHGTRVAGIAAAMDNDIGVVGTAPGARIWSIQVLGNNTNGKASDIMKGLTFVAEHIKDIEVVNISTQSFGFSVPVALAINLLVTRGLVVVVSAGNQNIDAVYMWPANVAKAITVSAITDTDGKCGGAGKPFSLSGKDIYHQRYSTGSVSNLDDFFSSFSNFGSMIDIAAPGVIIETTNNSGGYIITIGSTSFAAAHVAGAAALLRSLGAGPSQSEDFLLNLTSTKAPDTGNPLLPCNGAGRGYFNDEYPRSVPVLTDTIKEPLLYMGIP
jgi:subtilisin